ncbi:D-mannonate dehydratase ManD [Silvibacterium dinghuense]|uniref:D-galactonate dehydratase family protein n=1 Tax=Silvibacterium dinghuense TaxID=1560006 RepID=A0A4Q1S9Q0_9BACT|nr:D-mannonate dehydratase ManD [Silvibacterium dinghuense]RXS93665.1 D-galactonate dehydratase family protein [Silvibacterium dinghuense]GGH06613.1 mandelate racemase [Silvibacterium dinghuense]
MKITNAYVNICSPGRNFVTLKIETDQGIYGLGDGTLNGRELAVASYLTDHVLPCLIGRDPFQIEDIWQYLYRGAYWRRGPVTMSAIAAVDMALWDIKGKALHTPVYNLLGGRSRQGVMVYCHAFGKDIHAALEDVAKHKEMGYRAIRVQSGVPGLKSTYGVGKTTGYYEPAERGLPTEYEWETESYLRSVPGLFAKVREVFGEEIHLLHDCHHRLTPIEAARLGKELEPFHLFWIEDPTPAELQEGFKLIRQHTTTPIAVGEVFNSLWDAHDLIRNQWIDYIRATVVHAGGLTHLKKIADFADLYHVKTGCHGATDLSPVSMAAALHFDTAIHNFGIQEHMPHAAETDAVFPHAYFFKDGYMYPGDKPGLGIDFDEKLASQYEYQRAYLPVNRRQDGTLTDW